MTYFMFFVLIASAAGYQRQVIRGVIKELTLRSYGELTVNLVWPQSVQYTKPIHKIFFMA